MLVKRRPGWATWWRAGLTLGVVTVLLCLGAANILLRANWHEVEDGVLWVAQPEGVLAQEVLAGGPGDQAGLSAGDVLLAIDGQPIDQPLDVVSWLHGASGGTNLTYTVVRLGAREVLEITLQPISQGNRALYFVLAAVAIFTLLVGLSVRLRRPGDQATLHFFWLCVAFFGVFAFSFSGRLDRLDWFFYWADVVSILLLPPLFVHFSMVFPDRPNAWVRSTVGRAALPAVYLPALLLGAGRVAVFTPVPVASYLQSALELFDRLELIHLAICLAAGLAIWVHATSQIRSVTARRQLRWIIGGTSLGATPFVVGYAVPFALGWTAIPRIELTAIPLGLVPLAFASAIIRYRLMDVEVIIKRTLVYTAALSAIVATYAVLLRLASVVFLGGSQQHNSVIAVLATLVVVLIAKPLKDTIQDTLDRVYYRDRYDYRRALVGFARDLSSDLDLDRLTDRLVARVKETLLVDRIAVMLAPPDDEAGGRFSVIRAEGFQNGRPPLLACESGIGRRLRAGHAVVLDDPRTGHRVASAELMEWRQRGVNYFVPCVHKKTTIAVIALSHRDGVEPLNSEDLALLTAVAGQVATALENGRLYQRLRIKADELQQMREFSENVIESLHDGLVVVDLDDRVVRWNQQLERIYGISQHEAVGRTLDALFDSEFLESIRTSTSPNDRAPDDVHRVALVTRHAEPRQLLVNAATVPLRTPDGQAGTVVLIEDTTDRVQLEEQLQISEKMASIGVLAAGVAHEVNTPLTGISSFTQMLLERADADGADAKLLEKIERQTVRASKIVNGLLDLARPGKLEAGAVDVNAVVTDVLSLLEHQLKTSNVQVRRECASPAPMVHGVEHKLQQVFLNLCINAKDAMPKGGWLTVRSRLDGDRVVVEVADTGSGIRREDLSRIYDPFFTTKEIGQGTGLGLAITYGIVQEHVGAIACHSTPGQGTEFVLTLPCATVGTRPAHQAAP